MAHAGVVVGMDTGRQGGVAVVARTDITRVLRSPQVVVYGDTEVQVALSVIVTRVTGSRDRGWALCDAPTHLAEIHSVLALAGMVEGGLAGCSSLPDGQVLVVAPQEVADELADVHGAAWLMEGAEGEGSQMLLRVEIQGCLGWSARVVAAVVVVVEKEFGEEVVQVVAEMVGEMGVVVVVS